MPRFTFNSATLDSKQPDSPVELPALGSCQPVGDMAVTVCWLMPHSLKYLRKTSFVSSGAEYRNSVENRTASHTDSHLLPSLAFIL